MARINFEDEIAADARFRRLVKLLDGDEDKANGMLLRFWRLAQKYWGNGLLVPFDEFKAEELQPILTCGLAEVRELGVYAKGSELRFDWYLQRVEAGKRSVASRKLKSERNACSVITGSSSVITSIPLSSSPLSSTLNNKSNTKELKGRSASPVPVRSISKVIGTYVQAFQSRYGTRPDVGGKVQGLFKTMLKDLTEDQLCLLVQAYLQMDGTGSWFKKKFHDVGTLYENRNQVLVALATGNQDPTSGTDWAAVWAAVDKKESHGQADVQ